jgi:2-hydroxychromene-2-carboxylate isomerase
MGELIILSDHRRAKVTVGEGRGTRVTFAFDLASPHTYLAAERVDRMFTDVQWRPVITGFPAVPELDAATQMRATALRLPLVWPERHAVAAVAARRVASFAASIGHGPAFVLAASRLAFCGGFDLDDPEILAEAAAAANLPLDECLTAAGDRSLDAEMLEAGRRLVGLGADRLPVLQVGDLLFCGEERLTEASAAARGGAPIARGFKPA